MSKRKGLRILLGDVFSSCLLFPQVPLKAPDSQMTVFQYICKLQNCIAPLRRCHLYDRGWQFCLVTTGPFFAHCRSSSNPLPSQAVHFHHPKSNSILLIFFLMGPTLSITERKSISTATYPENLDLKSPSIHRWCRSYRSQTWLSPYLSPDEIWIRDRYSVMTSWHLNRLAVCRNMNFNWTS